MAAITYKCPNCDGGLIFDPSSQKYHCEYCLSDFTQEELESLSQELVRRKAEHQEPGLQEQDRQGTGAPGAGRCRGTAGSLYLPQLRSPDCDGRNHCSDFLLLLP